MSKHRADSPLGVFSKLAQQRGQKDLEFDSYETQWEPFRWSHLSDKMEFRAPTPLQLTVYKYKTSRWYSQDESINTFLLKQWSDTARKKGIKDSNMAAYQSADAIRDACNFLGEVEADRVKEATDKYRYMSKEHAYELIRSIEERTMGHRAASHISKVTETETKSSGTSCSGPTTTVQRGLIFNKVSTTSGSCGSSSSKSSSKSTTYEQGHGAAVSELSVVLSYMYFIRPQNAGGRLLHAAAIDEKLQILRLAHAARMYLNWERGVNRNNWEYNNYGAQYAVIDEGREQMLEDIDANPTNWSDAPETTW